MLFELRTGTGVLGPVTRIVHTRRDFIDQKLAAFQLEQLDSEHADMIETAADGAGDDITGYYEHWLAAAEKLLVAEGLVSADELAARKAHVAAHRAHPTIAVPNPVAIDPGLTPDR